MTWTKLGAEWPDEARSLSDAEYRLHVDALCYSNRRGLDLLIPKTDVRRFAEVADPDAAIRGLVRQEWWEDRGDAWWVGCRFPGWQRTREQVEGKRRTDNAAQKRKRMHDQSDHALCLPRSCPFAPSAHDSAHGSAHDSGAVSASFSERNGTAVITGPTTNKFGIGGCRACRSYEGLDCDGYCSRCSAVPA